MFIKGHEALTKQKELPAMYQKIDPVVAGSAHQFKSAIHHANFVVRATTGLDRAAELAAEGKMNLFDMPLASQVRHGYLTPFGDLTNKGVERCTNADWNSPVFDPEPIHEFVKPVVFVGVDGPEIDDPSEYFDRLTWSNPMRHPVEEATASTSSFAQKAMEQSAEAIQAGPATEKVSEAFSKAQPTPEQAKTFANHCVEAAAVAYSKTKDFVRENPKTSMLIVGALFAVMAYMYVRSEQKKEK